MKHKNGPDFLIIGAMKAGTTSLHYYLSQHPYIKMTQPKELHFFDDKNFSESSLTNYFNNFITKPGMKSGSAPQGYSKTHLQNYSNVPKRLFEYCPHIKIIYIIRNPIERIYSHFKEQQSGGYQESLNINDYLENVKTSHIVKTSLYFMQIANYMKYFPKDQIKIIELDNLKEAPENTLSDIYKFLQVKNFPLDKLDLKIKNSSDNKSRKIFLSQLLPKSLLTIYKSVLPSSLRNYFNKNLTSKLHLKNNLKYSEIENKKLIKLKQVLLNDSLLLQKEFGLKLNYIDKLK